MTQDIKATVAELVAKWGDASKDCEEADAFVDQLVASWPSLLAELRRLWAKEARQDAIEEAAVSLRDAQKTYGALFELLDAKPSGGEEAR